MLASVGRVIFAKISKTQDTTNKEVKMLFKMCAFKVTRSTHNTVKGMVIKKTKQLDDLL